MKYNDGSRLSQLVQSIVVGAILLTIVRILFNLTIMKGR